MVKPVGGVGDGSEEGEIPSGGGDEIEANTEGAVGLGNLAQSCPRRREIGGGCGGGGGGDFGRHIVCCRWDVLKT